MSKYKSVSKNKKKCQIYIFIQGKNTYLGTYILEKIAAKIYDFMALKKMVIKLKQILNIILDKLRKFLKLILILIIYLI